MEWVNRRVQTLLDRKPSNWVLAGLAGAAIGALAQAVAQWSGVMDWGFPIWVWLVIVLVIFVIWWFERANYYRSLILPGVDFVTTNHSLSHHRARVAIRTKETSTVNGLRVLLIDIRKDATDQQPIVIDHLLIERKSGNAITDMNPGEVYYYTLARLDDNGDILCGPFKRRHPYKLPYTPALLKVRVSAQGMSTLAQFYRIDKSASGELQFAPIGLSG